RTRTRAACSGQAEQRQQSQRRQQTNAELGGTHHSTQASGACYSLSGRPGSGAGSGGVPSSGGGYGSGTWAGCGGFPSSGGGYGRFGSFGVTISVSCTGRRARRILSSAPASRSASSSSMRF